MPNEIRLDYRGASEYLGLAEATLRKYVSLRRVAHYKLGRLVRFSIQDLDRWIASRHVPAKVDRRQ